MNVVKDLPNLINLLHSCEEVIAFPIGSEGQSFMDFLRYTNFLRRVCCIAAPKVPCGVSQEFIHEIPIIPFECLGHFNKTAIIVVAAPEQFYSHLNKELKNYFQHIVFIRSETFKQIESNLQDLYKTGQVLMWYMRRFDKKLFELECQIEDQNEVLITHQKSFVNYRNAFRENKIVIVGCGPTLSYYKPISNAIHIGLNFAWKAENIDFDYLFVQDRGGYDFKTLNFAHGFSKIRKKIFIGKSISRHTNRPNFPEEILSRENVLEYYLDEKPSNKIMYQDITCHPFLCFGSVSFAAFTFALFTSPRTIYLVGLDTNLNSTNPQNHFFVHPDVKKDSPVSYNRALKVGYARMKMFAKQYYPDTEIVSINPVGLRGLFRDVYTDEYKAALNNQNNAFEKQ